MKYIEVTGKTESEALRRALAKLGLDRDDVSVEVLERAKSGFLGIGSSPAKIRVSYGVDEPEVPTEEPQPKKKSAPAKPSEPKPQPQKKPAPKAEPAPVPQQKEAPKVTSPVASTQDFSMAMQYGEEIFDEKAESIRTFLSGLLERLEHQATIHVYMGEKGRYKVVLEGKNMGQLIGHRGETLDAIQQLTVYAVNRGAGNRIRIQLDAENYRQKREKSLERLARKMAGKAKKYNRNMTLEPMNAYERHVIHTALQDEAGVKTYSTGSEPNRRVVVMLDWDQN